ncbi:glycosyltransferase [Candidatus Microgenomates bacterium]|nr:glycosyltransferase [Candidatus Microgenomates bacterium]
MKPRLSVVIPAYNEASNFRSGVLKPVVDFLSQQKFSWEVLFVNDGSTDDTKKLLTSFCRSHRGYKLITISHGGKVAAVSAGMLSAEGEIVLFTDFDQSTPLFQATNFLAAHQKGYDVVIGDRGVTTMKNNAFRRFRSWVLVTIVQIILVPGIRDSQCGFKSFKNSVAKRIFNNLQVTNVGKVVGGYMGAWDAEALFLANKFGYKITQVPVEWVKVEGQRLNPVTEPIKMLRDIFKVRFFDLLGRYQK